MSGFAGTYIKKHFCFVAISFRISRGAVNVKSNSDPNERKMFMKRIKITKAIAFAEALAILTGSLAGCSEVNVRDEAPVYTAESGESTVDKPNETDSSVHTDDSDSASSAETTSSDNSEPAPVEIDNSDTTVDVPETPTAPTTSGTVSNSKPTATSSAPTASTPKPASSSSTASKPVTPTQSTSKPVTPPTPTVTTPHTHSYELANTSTDYTKSADGTTTRVITKTYACTVCGDSYNVKQTGTYSDPEPTPSSSSSSGTSTPSTSSSSSKPSSTSTPTVSHTHSYTSKTTKTATCTSTGVKTYTCKCGDSYTETIPMKAHNYTTVYGSKKVPKTEVWNLVNHYWYFYKAKSEICNFDEVTKVDINTPYDPSNRGTSYCFCDVQYWEPQSGDGRKEYIFNYNTGLNVDKKLWDAIFDDVERIIEERNIITEKRPGELVGSNWSFGQAILKQETRPCPGEYVIEPDNKTVCTVCGHEKS